MYLKCIKSLKIIKRKEYRWFQTTEENPKAKNFDAQFVRSEERCAVNPEIKILSREGY